MFFIHDSVKKRAIECFLETAKIAFRGRKIKFDYILNDGSKVTMEIDGDEFAECDYGLVVDCGNDVQELNQQLGTLAQAALQNDKMNFSTLMKIYTTKSIAEKQRLIERYEQRVEEQRQQELLQNQQLQQQQMQIQAQTEQAKMQQEYLMHQEDNETKLLVAEINSKAEAERFAMMNHDNEEANNFTQQELDEKKRQFDAKIKQDAAKLEFDKKKHQDDVRLKEKQINKSTTKK